MITLNNIPLDHYMELVLRCRPFAIIRQGDDVWNALQSIQPDDRTQYVIEREEWTILMDNLPMGLGSPDLYRVWHLKDWELCHNRQIMVVKNIEIRQQAYRVKLDHMRAAIGKSMLANGVSQQIWEMLSATMNDDQVVSMHSALPTEQQHTD